MRSAPGWVACRAARCAWRSTYSSRTTLDGVSSWSPHRHYAGCLSTLTQRYLDVYTSISPSDSAILAMPVGHIFGPSSHFRPIRAGVSVMDHPACRRPFTMQLYPLFADLT